MISAGTVAAAKSIKDTANPNGQCKAPQGHGSSSSTGAANGGLSALRSLSLTRAEAPGSYIKSTGVYG
jgi:hypothetical protein